jgi:PAS domain S-box-containing protein
MVKSVFQKISKFRLAALAGEYQEEFAREASFVNLARARMFAVILVVLQVPLLYLDYQNRLKGLWLDVPGYRFLCEMHLLIGGLFFFYTLIAFTQKPKTALHITARHSFLAALFAAFGMLISAGVSVVDQMIHGQITVYIIASFWVAAGLYLGNVLSFFLYLIVYLLFIAGLYAVQHDPNLFLGNFINGTLLSILAWALSRVVYAAKVRDFVNNKIIHQQNMLVKELEEKKHHREKEELQEAVEKATMSLLESELKFRTLAETTAAVIIIHRGGTLLYVNLSCEKVTGYTREEFMAMNFWEIIHPDQRELVRERGQARLYGKEPPTEYEFKILTKQGEVRWATTTAGVIEYEGKHAVIATLFDITDRKRAEVEKVKLYEERIAEEKKHLMEKDKLLMDLHDGIGGITTNIRILSALAQNATDTEHIRKTLGTISQLSLEGVSEIRSFMQSLDARELSWSALSPELRRQGAGMTEPHSMAFTLEASIADIEGRPGSLLWVNLFRIYKEALTNIIKHSRACSVDVTLKVDESRLQLTVQDDGIGWDEFRKSGRGLSNMKKRAEELGGGVTVSAEKGVRVSLNVPLPSKHPMPG